MSALILAYFGRFFNPILLISLLGHRIRSITKEWDPRARALMSLCYSPSSASSSRGRAGHSLGGSSVRILDRDPELWPSVSLLSLRVEPWNSQHSCKA
ncbi:hypothetical protein BJV74DRAFT_825160 [Russula compacta]|nr:hypothetical protein BJV74DRAFT_825160 [Russula compacta]